MNIEQEIDGNEKIFTVQVINRSTSKKINISIGDVENTIRSRYNLIKEEYDFLTNKSSGKLTNSTPSGKYIFQKKVIDIADDSVTIDKIIEAESHSVKEQTKEASLTSETLPYGLKSTTKKTTTKKKRTTKKKITEE